MHEPQITGHSSAPAAIAAGGAVTLAALECARHAAGWSESGGLSVTLAVVAVASAAMGAGNGRIRLSMAPVLAAFVALPPGLGLAVALAASLAAAGSAPAGGFATGPRGLAGNACGLVAAHFVALTIFPRVVLPGWEALFGLAAVYVVAHLGSFGVTALLAAIDHPPPRSEARAAAKIVARESVSVPLAWLFSFPGEGRILAPAVLGGLVVLGAWLLVQLHRGRLDVEGLRRSLGERVAELATLHAVGREVLSSLEPERVFSVVERECRKILEADAFSLCVVDRDTGLLHRTSTGSGADGGDRSIALLDESLARWALSERRPLRIDDLEDARVRPDVRRHARACAFRAALAVPMDVGGRAVGVLAIASRRPRAYDDHLLAVLTTVAQQAAVAIENARNHALATVDSLTGLFLRDYFFRRLEEEHHRARRYGQPFCLLMLDLDEFKEVNDRHGHLSGDRYLRAVGAVVRGALRAADLACRYGGDEFCLLLPETTLEAAGPIAERLRQAVAALVVEIEGMPVRSTVSIGVAAFPDHDTGDLRALLMRADQALYWAKRAGRDRVVPFAA